MAIEPLSSAMSYTAQPITRPQPAASGTEAEQAQSVETNAPQVDAKTLAVAKTQNEEGEGKDDSKGQQSQQKKSSQQQISDDQIKKALDELNRKQTNFISEFGIHEKTNRITVKIVDKTTKEVIKELPPEKMLDMIAKVWEYAGLVVDEKR